jgi:protein involved in polysaccharide export with SLBB domain
VEFPVTGDLDLQTAIGLAGGLTEIADADRITVKRKDTVYAASFQDGLAPGDVVSVPPNRFVGKTVTVTGLVSSPGAVPFPPDGKLDILSAIAQAGDFDRLANKKKVTVTRRGDAGDQSWKFDLTEMAEGKAALFHLLPDDIVSVPERRF